jgi:hypothetical protein
MRSRFSSFISIAASARLRCEFILTLRYAKEHRVAKWVSQRDNV